MEDIRRQSGEPSEAEPAPAVGASAPVENPLAAAANSTTEAAAGLPEIIWYQPEQATRAEVGTTSTYTLSSLMFLTAIAAVCCAAFQVNAALGIIAVVILLPTLILTAIWVNHAKRTRRRMKPDERLGLFFESLGIAASILLTGLLMFLLLYAALVFGLGIFQNIRNLVEENSLIAIMLAAIPACWFMGKQFQSALPRKNALLARFERDE